MSSRAPTCRPSNQVKADSRPWRAAAWKLPLASSKLMRVVTSSTSLAKAAMSPNQKAALAISSTGVGPEGSTRFSIRRCGLPSRMP